MVDKSLYSGFYLRLKILKGMAISIGIFSLFLSIINFANGTYILASLEVLLCFVCVAVYRKTIKSPKTMGYAYLLPYFLLSIIIYGTYSSSLSVGLFLWSYTTPTIFYLLFGLRHGFITSMIVLVLQFLIITNKEDLAVYNTTAISVNFGLAYLAVWVVAHIYEKYRSRTQNELRRQALTDPLTGAYNRLALNNTYKTMLNSNTPRAIALIDIDFFKKINDIHGHDGGDHVLKRFIEEFSQFFQSDQYYRLGGEEFAILVDANEYDLEKITNQLRSHIEHLSLKHNDQSIKLTFSAGIAIDKTFLSLSELLKQADIKLYRAKSNGRNQVVI